MLSPQPSWQTPSIGRDHEAPDVPATAPASNRGWRTMPSRDIEGRLFSGVSPSAAPNSRSLPNPHADRVVQALSRRIGRRPGEQASVDSLATKVLFERPVYPLKTPKVSPARMPSNRRTATRLSGVDRRPKDQLVLGSKRQW